ncbi:MAG TPA: biotin--[acetyl-CoA-carboxylase] ligase [Clostridiales bacterium]|nr:biotin--[acetyl-CoA-carboxylase] ligase [Clostridiales bacterium]
MLKNNLISLLEANKGNFISGQELADKLYVTRSAIWKVIKLLRMEGYNIEAVTNKGYRLAESNDIISVQSITPFLKGTAKQFRIDIRKSLSSTNTELKKLAASGEKAGLVLIANEQTAGKGRMGRSFYSPADSGIYMSVLLRPNLTSDKAVLLTSLVAVSVVKAIEQVSGITVGIKWVNDLFLDDKKIVGILTEGGIDMENGMLEYAVVGIGVNVFTENFPMEISNIATSVIDKANEKKFSRSLLAAEILNQLALDLPKLESMSHIPEYKKRSILIGKEIYVIKNSLQIPAVALDIDDNASLIVKYEDGKIETLSSNDVSIRRKI